MTSGGVVVFQSGEGYFLRSTTFFVGGVIAADSHAALDRNISVSVVVVSMDSTTTLHYSRESTVQFRHIPLHPFISPVSRLIYPRLSSIGCGDLSVMQPRTVHLDVLDGGVFCQPVGQRCRPLA